MITQIGIVAGDIWHILERKGTVNFSELVDNIDKSRELILMSLGWLAREGHILLEGEEDYSISLRNK